ncbi:MAG: Sec-independent protein translocase TatC [Halobacteriaceae archaeon]
MSGSGLVDEDTADAVRSGRETLGAVLRAAQKRLQRVFIVFVVGLLVGIYAMREFVWPQLKRDLLVAEADVIAQTPFDVILLQVKIGLILGVLLTVPALLYYARDPLRERGIIRDVPVARWKAAAVAALAVVLFAGGSVYAYNLFFPLMLAFLADNATSAGFAPLYSIVAWTQFILVLGISFGLAAQLPLVMTALSYSGVVPYETFRDKWRYAVVVIFGFGAVFSPPDPFTQVLWAFPLVALYGFSLYLSKLVVTAKRGSADVDLREAVRARWNHVAGAGVLGAGAGVAVARADLLLAANDLLATAGSAYRFDALDPVVGGAVLGLLGLAAATLYVVYDAFEGAAAAAGPPGAVGRAASIDLAALDAEGVRAAPPEAFDAMDEEDALAAANRALDEDDREKAAAIMDRFEESEARAEGSDDGADGGAEAATEEETPVLSGTATVVDSVTEEETTEDDIGGYLYDLRFIAASLRSRLFRIAVVFIGVMLATFTSLYRGGIGAIRRDFLARMPVEVPAEEAVGNWPITLHPVEALVFEVKMSVIAGAIVALPLVAYYAWPALRERTGVGGDQRSIAVWGGSLFLGLLGGIAVGYGYIAPAVISWLVADGVAADMVISFRVKDFFWMVFLLTAGIGLLADVPITMVLFERAGIVPYSVMRERWRGVALAAFAFAALVTPESVFTLFLVALPLIAAYWFGLGILWVLTLGGRRERAARPAAE